MIDAIRAICQQLIGPAQTPDALLSSMDTRLWEAVRVDPAPGTPDEAAQVRLTLPDAATLTLGDLSAAFGDYRTPPRIKPESPQQVAFSYEAESVAGCTIFARVDPSAEITATTEVQSLFLRRDLLLR